MTKLERGFNPEIQHLYDEILLPYDSNLGLKFAKKRLIEHLGFAKVEGGFNLSRDFVSSEPEAGDRILSFVLSEMDTGHFLTLRIINDEGEKGGGYPVVYVLRPSDIQRHFVFAQDGSLQGFKSTDGRLVTLEKKLLINIFSRKQSFEGEMTGLENYPGIKVARMGGGFRLQLSQLAFEDRKPVFRFSTVFTFDDVGPRSTSLPAIMISVYRMLPPLLTWVTKIDALLRRKRHLILKRWGQV